jgi:hypothetical protein
MRLGPRAHGQPWTPAKDARLLALLEAKVDRALIAHKLNGSRSARHFLLNKHREGEPGLKAKGAKI